eukprot:6172292-Pleurochrysis_carterae.AAC.2
MTIAVRNLPGNPSRQSKFTAQHYCASVGRGRDERSVCVRIEQDWSAWMAEQSSTPERTCARSWMCPSASANPAKYVQACREAKEGKEAEALEFMANALPSLPPAPPAIDTDDEYGRPAAAGPSEPPEGHELQAKGDAAQGSDSGETDATDVDLTALARQAHNDLAILRHDRSRR